MTEGFSPEETDKAYRRWLERTHREGAGARQEEPRTDSDIEVRPAYGPHDPDAEGPLHGQGFPGQPPFTRGIHPTMYRGRLWTMRQYAGFGTAEETNERFRYLLSQGQTGLSVAFDLPTQMGYDPDHPMARGEVGRVGVSISTAGDMAALLRDLPLDQASTSMTINATAAILLGLYATVAERSGVPPQTLRGTVQNDILKEYAARGTYIYPVEPAMKLATDLIEWSTTEMPRWNPISISGYHMREAGCNAVQEVAFTLGNGIAYVERVLDRGLAADAFAHRLSFFFAAQMDILEEVAKFRAARRLWGKIMAERFGAEEVRSRRLRFHAQTAGAALTAQQPHLNVVRATLQALAAVLGGTQSLHVNAMDEALGLPTKGTAQLALRTQQILAHESGVGNTVDPVAGSYYIEALTDEIESRAAKYLERIEQLGGMERALERGFVQKEIAGEAFRFQQEVEAGERQIVGVNAYVEDEPPSVEITRIDPDLEERRTTGIRRLREGRDQSTVERVLAALQETAEEGENLMPAVLEAVRRHATLGEVSDALRAVYGTYRSLQEF
ncbi:MAG: methylmalonyl-CoA mutase family protein [Candidatus Thermoplasmatota archaeon]|nr:methylmalonyl-CoA mutase family protein [Candidatus Thermoplasmatota archaeon]